MWQRSVGNAQVLAARHAQSTGVGVLGHGGATAHGATCANHHWGHPHAVVVNVNTRLDLGAVLVGPIVTGGDAARTIVQPLARHASPK
jgi:hypothetical protein